MYKHTYTPQKGNLSKGGVDQAENDEGQPGKAGKDEFPAE